MEGLQQLVNSKFSILNKGNYAFCINDISLKAMYSTMYFLILRLHGKSFN